jgi:hypothetical protein
MLAFDVSVYRLPEKDPSGEVNRNEQLLRGDYDELLMLWTVRAEPGCLGWIETLVDRGKAARLQGNGYPMLYVGDADAIVDGALREVNASPDVVDRLERCRGDDALVVTAWDLS